MGIIKRLIFLVLFILSKGENRSKLIRFFYGCKIGKNVRFEGLPVIGTEPELISIGDNVTIARNVVFHTHDGGVRLLRNEYPGINVYGNIIIGNNVFIGSDTIILPNTTIGNNVIIGTGSVVSKNISDDIVAAGVPAKKIKSLSDYKIAVLSKATFLKES